MPLLDLTLLCLLRLITYAVFSVRDEYLLSNTSAILQNLTPHVGALLPYTAERIVKVTRRLCARAATVADTTAAGVAGAAEEAAVLPEAIACLLALIDAAIG